MTKFDLYGSEVKDGYGGYILEDVYTSKGICVSQESKYSSCHQVTLNLPKSKREFAEFVLDMLEAGDYYSEISQLATEMYDIKWDREEEQNNFDRSNLT